jgi:hypothetical protein
MGYHLAWDNDDKTVLLQAYTDPVTKDDLYHLVKKSAEMLATCDHTVHLIIDERKVNFVLNSADLGYIQKMLPPNQGTVVLVVLPGNQMYKRIFLKSVRHQVDRTETQFAETPHQARLLLQELYEDVHYPSNSDRAS